MLGKPSSIVVPVVHCTRALSQRVKWGQSPTLALSGRKPSLAWRKGGLFPTPAQTTSSYHAPHQHRARLTCSGWTSFPNFLKGARWARRGLNTYPQSSE